VVISDRPSSRAAGRPFRDLLEQARTSLDAAVVTAPTDPEATLDDLMAARLLIATALHVLAD